MSRLPTMWTSPQTARFFPHLPAGQWPMAEQMGAMAPNSSLHDTRHRPLRHCPLISCPKAEFS